MDSEALEPLLLLHRARIQTSGAIGEVLTARGGQARLTLVGDARPLFRLLGRDATLAAGEARVAGFPADSVVVSGQAGLALHDPGLPPEWTPERYLLESARLAGMRERDAKREVDAALTRFELTASARRRFRDLYVAIQRVVLFAHATLGSPPLLCIEAPLSALDTGSEAYVDAALERAAHGRRLLSSVLSLGSAAERALVERADWVITLHGGRIVQEGPPTPLLARSTRYAATVTRAAAAFLAALAERGVQATPADTAPALLGFVPKSGTEVRRVLIELPAGTSPDDIVRAAHHVGAPLVELRAV